MDILINRTLYFEPMTVRSEGEISPHCANVADFKNKHNKLKDKKNGEVLIKWNNTVIMCFISITGTQLFHPTMCVM